MNESWRQAEADAHEAKADAIRAALETLEGLNGALEPLEDAVLKPACEMLGVSLRRHEQKAALVKAG